MSDEELSEAEKLEKLSGSGKVVFNAYGGHFEVRTKDDVPPDAPDVVSDRMYHWLTEVNESHHWEITTHHIKDGVPICSVSWEPDEDWEKEPSLYHVTWDVDLPDGIKMDWYSRERLWEWDD